MNCVILAGGRGARLLPLTDLTPKPMLNVANAPIIDYAVSHMYCEGIKDFVYTLGYLADEIVDWASGYKSVSSRFMFEQAPLGTLGGVKAAQEYLDDRFIVLSGDALENVDISALVRSHFDSGNEVTIAVKKVTNASKYGVVDFDDNYKITRFTEKPCVDDSTEFYVNCGIYVVNRSVLDRVPRDSFQDFSRDLFPRLVAENAIGAYVHDGYWCDIGDYTSYFNANFHALEGGFFPLAIRSDRKVSTYLGANESLIGYGACAVGECRASILGCNSRVPSNASACNCIVMPDVTVVGNHYGEIIGNGWTVKVRSAKSAPDFTLFGPRAYR